MLKKYRREIVLQAAAPGEAGPRQEGVQKRLTSVIHQGLADAVASGIANSESARLPGHGDPQHGVHPPDQSAARR
jgi:hypothetical protein